MVGEIQEPFNLSLLENSIHSGSVSFGRFEKEGLSWEKRSSFSHNRYLEEAEKFSKPGSVTQMRAHFEAHFKKKGIRFPSCVEAQSLGQAVHHHQQQTDTEKDESMSQCSYHSYVQDKFDQEKSQFGDSCVSYDDEEESSISVALEKTEIGRSEMTLKDEKEMKASSVKKPLKSVQKPFLHAAATKVASTKKHVVITKGSPSCSYTNTSTVDTKSQKELKPKRIVKTITSQAQTSKNFETLTPLATNKYKTKSCNDPVTREKRTTNKGFSLPTNERAEKKREDIVVRKALDFKERPMTKSTKSRPQNMSKGQTKTIDDAQEHSCKASSDRSLANGPVKSKLNVYKQRFDLMKSLNGSMQKSSDQTARNNVKRSLVVRRSAVDVAL